MAGYALGFDDGGDVPGEGYDGQDFIPQPGQAPSVGGTADGARSPDQLEDMGDPPAMQTMAQETPGQFASGVAQKVGQDVQEGNQHLMKDPAVKRIASYLMGDGGADPAAAKKFALGIQHEYPGVSPDDANLLAVQKAFELGGPQAAWAMVQFNRQAYNAKQSFAEAALQGVQGKPADPHAAADAATKASQHILDGSSSQFRANRDGSVTAAVKLPGTDQEQHFQLSPQAFQAYVSVGKDGQYDRVFEQGGVPATLARLATTYPGRQLSANEDKVQATGKSSAVDAASPDADQPGAPGMFDKTGKYLGPREPDQTNYGAEREARSTAIFGKGNVGHEPERQQWMSADEEKDLERQNKIDQAKEKGVQANRRAEIMAGGRAHEAEIKTGGAKDVAGINAGSREKVAGTRADVYSERTKAQALAAVQKQAAAAQTQGEKNRLAQARLEINDPNTVLRKPGDVDAIFKKYGVNAPTAVPTSQDQGQQGNSQDQQALLWAQANPKDPRAAKILQHLGQ